MNEQAPKPGRDADPDSTTEGVDPAVETHGERVIKREQSSLGPGTGENDVVKVTSPVQHEDDEVTSHPSLRDDERSGER